MAAPNPIPLLKRDDKARFWDCVSVIDSRSLCWPWVGTRLPAQHGNQKLGTYGQFRIGRHNYMAHRVAYVLAYGSIPQGMLVLHKCDTPYCVNPHHLCLGTQRDNVLDMVAKNRHGRTPRARERALERKEPRMVRLARLGWGSVA